MIKITLAVMLGERKLRIADVARDTGVNRGTLTRLYYETAERIDLESLEVLCRYLDCGVGELLVHVPDRLEQGATVIDHADSRRRPQTAQPIPGRSGE